MNISKQQGDVLIKSAAIPADAKPIKSHVLAEGEGHHLHRFATSCAANVQLFEKDGIKFARITGDATIEHVTPDGGHGEHHSITLPAGDYAFGQVQEYDYLNEMARPVID